MHITIFTVIVAVFFGTVLALGLHGLRKKEPFLRIFGIRVVLFLYLLCMLRMVLPVEFSFAVPVGVTVLDSLVNILHMPCLNPQWNVGKLLALIWTAGTVLFLVAFLVRETCISYQLRKRAGIRHEYAERILETVKAQAPRRLDVPVRVYKQGLDLPIGTGLIHPQICLPNNEYEPKELYYILKHEYTHFCNRDLQIKFLVHMYCCLFWWNPVVWLLKKDINQILEIKCDLTVTKAFSHREKTEYLAVILRSIMALGHRAPYVSPLGTPLFAAGSGQELVERFRLITTPGKKLAGWCIAICITFYVLLLAGSYFFVFRPTSYVLVDSQNAFPNSRIWELLALLLCGGCWYSGIKIEKKGVGETVIFLLTEIRYRLSRALGKAVILVLAAVMLVISMGAYMGNLQAQQTMLDHLADSIPVTARVMNRAGTQSTRIFIDTERYDVLTSLNVHDIRCTAGAAGGVAGKFVQAGHEPGGDMMMRAANCLETIPALSVDRMAYGEEYGPEFLSSNQAACGISEPYAQKMGVRLGDYIALPVYTLTYYSSGEEYTYIGDHALQVAAIYPYNEVNGERTPDMVVPAAWLRTSAERAGEPFYYSSLSVNLDDPLHLTRFKETLINLGFVQAGNSSGFGTCDAISVEDELFIKTAEDLRETLKIYRGFQVPFFGLVTGTVMLTVFLVLRSSRKDIAIASSIGEGRLRTNFVHFSSTVLTQMLGGMLASAILVAYVGITVSDSLWILSVYLLCASVGTMLAILQLMRFDTLSLLTQRN